MKPDPRMKSIMKTFAHDSPVVAPIERLLMAGGKWDDRDRTVIHPSSLASNDFCPRALFYQLMDVPVSTSNWSGIQREVIFAEGHEYHRKWQSWLWDAGRLGGTFHCLSCSTTFTDVAPTDCPTCAARREYLQYREVPLANEELNISGHADGLIYKGGREDPDEPSLLEVKSVGEGTIRMEDPSLLREHTYRVDVGPERTKSIVDHRGLWDSVKRPYGAHVRQVTIYGWCLGLKYATILYEYKPTGATKEFNIKLDYGLIEERLGKAADVLLAAQGKLPAPECEHAKCKKCAEYDTTGTDYATLPEEAEATSRDASSPRRGRPRARKRGPRTTEASPERDARTPRRGRQPERPEADGAVPGTRRLVRLREREAD